MTSIVAQLPVDNHLEVWRSAVTGNYILIGTILCDCRIRAAAPSAQEMVDYINKVFPGQPVTWNICASHWVHERGTVSTNLRAESRAPKARGGETIVEEPGRPFPAVSPTRNGSDAFEPAAVLAPHVVCSSARKLPFIPMLLLIAAFALASCCTSNGGPPRPCLPGSSDWRNNNIFR